MARQRQARPCSAHRTNGQPCGNYAITGGTVCAAHGGRARQVKAAAARRVAEAKALKAWAEFAPATNGDAAEPFDLLAELEALAATVTAFHRFTEDRLRRLSAADWLLTDPAALVALETWERAADRASRLLVALAGVGLESLRREAAQRRELAIDRYAWQWSASLDGLARALGHHPADPDVQAAIDLVLSDWQQADG